MSRFSVAEMRSMREAGFTYKEIGAKFDVPWSTIRARCRSLGIKGPEKTPYRPRNRPLKHQHPRWLINMLYWDCKLSTVEIAYELDISKNVVMHMMQRMQIDRRSKQEAADLVRQRGMQRAPSYRWTSETARAASLKAARKRKRRVQIREYKRQRRMQQKAA